jgi:hypothetical protein
MNDLLDRLDALADPPTRMPSPLPAPESGDPELDALFVMFDAPEVRCAMVDVPVEVRRQAQHEARLAQVEAKATLQAAPRSAVSATVATRWLGALAVDLAPAPVPAGFARSRDEQLELGRLLHPVTLAWAARRGVVQSHGDHVVIHDASAHTTLVRLVEAAPRFASSATKSFVAFPVTQTVGQLR